MIKSVKRRWNGLKLNIKFTITIVLLAILPVTMLIVALFYMMRQNTIEENKNYMQYTMERYYDNIKSNVDSVNMTVQFFLSDKSLTGLLQGAVSESDLSTKELYELFDTDIADLERLVSNNMLLYGVRVYAANDHVQEMMPILYKKSRMEKQEWAQKESYTGWNLNYSDLLFTNSENAGEEKIASLVTTVNDYEHGYIGTIEAVVTMEKLFPALFEDIDNEWSCFIAEDETVYFGKNRQDFSKDFMESEAKNCTEKEGIHTRYTKYGKKHLIVSYTYIKELGGTLVSVQDVSDSIRSVYRMRYLFLVCMVAVVIMLGVAIHFVVKRLLRQFYVTLKSIRQIQNGDLNVRIENCSNDEMGELGTQINRMLDRIEELMKESIDRELLAKNSEIRALQNQINAHFIYNVLESIKMMAEIDEEYAISDAVTSLGKLLRYSMKWVSGNVQVEEEIEYIKNYLALINLRFDYEIYLSLNIPQQIMKQEIPKMSLQPIIENAICHGIEELAEDTNIYMKGWIQDGDCIIEITDAGKGMTEDEIDKLKKKIAGEIETSGGSGNGIGLKNVQDRIRITFGEQYGIELHSKLGCYTKVSVRIPWQEPGQKKGELL